MYRVLICDDDVVSLENMREKVEGVFSGLGIRVKVHIYSDPQIISDQILSSCDLVFLDIDLSNYPTIQDMTNAIEASALVTLNNAKSYANDNFLKKTNTTQYTPTENYHPATKKYVDDAISDNITSMLGGEY